MPTPLPNPPTVPRPDDLDAPPARHGQRLGTARLRAEVAPHQRTLGIVVPVVGAGTIAWAVAFELGWAAPAFVVTAVACAALTVVDARTHRLPDVIVLPGWALTLTLLAGAALVDDVWSALVRALTASLALFVAYLLLALASPGGIGFGDVKLAGLLGGPLGWLGWSAVAGGTLAAFVLGGLVAVALLVTGRVTPRTAIAFGPYMVAGAVLAVALSV